MPRNGSGSYSLPTNSWNPAVNGVPATASDWQALINDVATAVTQSLSRDGQTTATGNLPMGGNKLTGLAAGTAVGDSLRWEQLFSQGQPQDLASAATTDIGDQLTTVLNITGTTTITSFGANYNGPRFLRFAGAVTLTNSASLVLPGNANITTAAGDCAIVVPLGTPASGWRVITYQRANAGNINGGQLAGNLNKIINGNFGINQRNVSGTVTLAAGAYGHDRWKAGASGCTYTFATVQNVTTITISAGSLMQVIEGNNLQSGTHVLSWTGTAQGRVDSGSYGTSGAVAGTAVGGTNQTIEFNTGTVSKVQYETGTVATPFEHRPYGAELALCQRYYQTGYGIETIFSGSVTSGSVYYVGVRFHSKMRASPSATVTTLGSLGFPATNSTIASTTVNGMQLQRTANATVTGGYFQDDWTASAEL